MSLPCLSAILSLPAPLLLSCLAALQSMQRVRVIIHHSSFLSFCNLRIHVAALPLGHSLTTCPIPSFRVFSLCAASKCILKSGSPSWLSLCSLRLPAAALSLGHPLTTRPPAAASFRVFSLCAERKCILQSVSSSWLSFRNLRRPAAAVLRNRSLTASPLLLLYFVDFFSLQHVRDIFHLDHYFGSPFATSASLSPLCSASALSHPPPFRCPFPCMFPRSW